MEVYIAKTDFLKEEENFRYYYGMVSPQRADKVDRMHFRKDQELTLLAGLVLREGLLRKGICYDDIQVAYGEYGKPYLSGCDKKVEFNLSHSGERVIGIFDEAPVGCDVESHNLARLEVAKRFFHPDEYEALALTGDARKETEDLFYRIWTLKESFMKACGLGMNLEMHTFSVMDAIRENSSHNGREDGVYSCIKTPLVNPVTQERYYLKEYFADDGFHYACCSMQRDFPKEPVILYFDS
ncbi:MAG: 4'-phosphopantetheinyl transferase superfamily protein [Lachnospiraceae bacterium]|nr:4'-phosphopantetheinyl transferase superfamily protein [Lachnospiraceae bacterium]